MQSNDNNDNKKNNNKQLDCSSAFSFTDWKNIMYQWKGGMSFKNIMININKKNKYLDIKKSIFIDKS